MSKVDKIGDLGTPERHNRGDLTTEIINKTKVARVRRKLSHENLHKRKTIDDIQFYTAEKFYSIYLMSQPRHNCEYREQIQGGKRELTSDRQLHYQGLFNKSLKQLEITEKTLIIHVIINDNPLNNQNMNAKKKRERRTLLISALDKLANFYNYT